MAKPQSFKPGDPRINRKGAPKKEWTMAGILRKALEEEDETGVPAKVIVNRKLVALAKRGDLTAIKEINNRIDGMATQRTELTGAEGSALQISITEDTALKDAQDEDDDTI